MCKEDLKKDVRFGGLSRNIRPPSTVVNTTITNNTANTDIVVDCNIGKEIFIIMPSLQNKGGRISMMV
jgi:hypothetical protein